jgi:hypothetical protein
MSDYKNDNNYIQLPANEVNLPDVAGMLRSRIIGDKCRLGIPMKCYPFNLLPGDVVFAYLGKGKDASATLWHSINNFFKNNDIQTPVYHLHKLEFIDTTVQPANGKIWRNHEILTAALYPAFVKYRDTLCWKFIHGIRDEVERALSSYFQNEFQHKGYQKKYLATWVDAAINYKQNYLTTTIERITEINCYEYNFDINIGYTIIKKNNFEILLYRYDKLSSCIKNALYDFTGYNIPIINSNITKYKNVLFDGIHIRDAYTNAKNEFRIPAG